LVNSEIINYQEKAINLLKDFKVYSGTLKRFNDNGMVTKILEYKYVPIDRNTMNLLLTLKSEADFILDENGLKDSFYQTIKFIKPNCTITSFKEKIVKRYQLITSKEKVINYLPGEVERRINIIKKRTQEYINDNNFDSEFINKIKDEEEIKLNEQRLQVEKIINSPKDYDVLITTKEEDLSYPALYLKYHDELGNKDRYDEHLRDQNILNVFVYEPEDKEKLKYANNKKIKNFKASGATYLLDTILFKKKNK